MGLKKKTILAFTVKLLFAASYLHAQVKTDSVKQKPISILSPFISKSLISQSSYINQIPGNFYSKKLPFFCDKELKIQKAVGFPIKFRVGSVDYCDRLEGKNK